jgi:hypothetical protein
MFVWAGHLFARAGHAWSISARFASMITSLACATSFFTIITALSCGPASRTSRLRSRRVTVRAGGWR